MPGATPRIPFDYLKSLYGENLEKYSYKEVSRRPPSTHLFRSENSYEKVREKILDYFFLVFIFAAAVIGFSYLLSSIVAA